jgi:uncharacterized membrane protein YeaQ/YmgE (transglycosylase-associated protein family)
MYVVWMLVIGVAVGAVAKLLVPGRDTSGIVAMMVLGVAGSFAAGFVGRALGWYRWEGNDAGFLASVVGAMLLLLAYRLLGGVRWSTVWRS